MCAPWRAMSLHAARQANPFADLVGATHGSSGVGALAGVLADAAVAAIRRR
jgi:hypothetical protein